MMARIAALREKYDLHMKVETYLAAEPAADEKQYIRE